MHARAKAVSKGLKRGEVGVGSGLRVSLGGGDSGGGGVGALELCGVGRLRRRSGRDGGGASSNGGVGRHRRLAGIGGFCLGPVAPSEALGPIFVEKTEGALSELATAMFAGGVGAKGCEVVSSTEAASGFRLGAGSAPLAFCAAAAETNALATATSVVVAGAAGRVDAVSASAVSGRSGTASRDLGANHRKVVGVVREEGGVPLAADEESDLRVSDG